MRKSAKNFLKSEDGAISADWVAITAAGMLLAVAVAGLLNNSAVAAGNQIEADVTAMATP